MHETKVGGIVGKTVQEPVAYVIKIRDMDSTINVQSNIQKSLERYEKEGEIFDDQTKYYPPKASERVEECEGYAYIMFVIYDTNGQVEFSADGQITVCDLKKIYLGRAKIEENKDKKANNPYIIKYCIHCCLVNPYVLVNLVDDIDLIGDYKYDSYVKPIKISSLIKKIEGILFSNVVRQPSDDVDKELGETVYKQKYEIKEYATSISHRMLKEKETSSDRNPFQRDRERIVNSRAFRRLVDKAQIFSANKGDHYRTRMTHTLEVNQIAKAIALALGLNLDLTEAIALGHDIGHTPFGHQGERTLKEILCKEVEKFHIFEDLGKDESSTLLGRFKHNIQGVRVLAQLEEKYVDYMGLNISVEVLEGILKHTKFDAKDVRHLFDAKLVEKLCVDVPYSTTLEGQTVAIADEIAQRGHDIDDAISSGLMSSREMMDLLEAKKYERLYNILKNEMEQIEERKRICVNAKKLLANRFVSGIIHFFITDVIAETRKILEDGANSIEQPQRIISFSKEGGDACRYLERIVRRKVINDAEVSGFDYHGDAIVRKLFYSYYQNPRLLHSGTLRRYYYTVLQHPQRAVADVAIDLSDANLDVLKHEIYCLTQMEIRCEDIPYDSEKACYLEKRKVLIRCIADYIAGMTDSYAKKEYEKLL